ncbi:MAG: DUF929 family protein [Thermoplasmata archaeon]
MGTAMVDWDRVEELRSKGWDWDRIAADPKVGFHPDSSVHDEGRALRGLYHRQKSREGRTGRDQAPPRPSKRDEEAREHRWSLPRTGYLLTPLVGIWAALAYLSPSPVGILLPAIPWLGIGLAVAAFILLFGLLRSRQARWSPIFRTTVVGGIVLGLVVAGSAGLVGYVAFGCPYLPPAAALGGLQEGWAHAGVGAWQQDGKPVFYFYGASWCPFCSAGSWALYKALSEFGTVTGASQALSFSSSTDSYPQTPEIILAGIGYSSSTISFVVNEVTDAPDGTFPATSNCYEQAYVGAYSANSIPFVVINGQYVHGGTPVIQPSLLTDWSYGSAGPTGPAQVLSQVNSENGSAWSVVQTQAWWTMAFLTKGTGESVATLAAQYSWSSATKAAVAADVAQLG